MKKLLAASGLAAIVVAGAFSLPGQAAAASNGHLAKAECKKERRFDRADFIRDYGRGKAAMVRCVRRELREARRECRLEKKRRPGEFRADYGKGKRAMVRCVRDELT